MRMRTFFDLLIFQTKANLHMEVSRLYLNYIWWIVDPCATMLIYYVVFGIFMNQATSHYVVFLLIGTTQWQWFSATVQHSAMSIQAASALMQRVDIPKILFPLVVYLQDACKHLLVMALLLLFLLVYPIQCTPAWLALPVLLALQGLWILAVSILFAALLPLMPDLSYVISTFLNTLFFVSGVFFDVDKLILPQHRWYMYLNPMAGFIREFRVVVLEGRWPDWHYLMQTTLTTLVFIAVAVWLLNRLDRLYPRICQQ